MKEVQGEDDEEQSQRLFLCRRTPNIWNNLYRKLMIKCHIIITLSLFKSLSIECTEIIALSSLTHTCTCTLIDWKLEDLKGRKAVKGRQTF